jgi:hypothetical protein
MGKLAALLAAAAIMGGSIMLFQSKRTGVETDQQQAYRQGQILAREIARSGHNMVLSQARREQREKPDLSITEVVKRVNGEDGVVRGELQGGSFEAFVYQTSSSSYRVQSAGFFEVSSHKVESERLEKDVLGEDILEVGQPSRLRVTFLQSKAGYCSAVYLQRILPDLAPENQPEPELIFTPGHNRDGASADAPDAADILLAPGTRMNFILAVDADFSCEREGDDIPITHSSYDYTRDALVDDVDDLGEMLEGKYAMIQQHDTQPGVWRIAFEDISPVTDARLLDTKQNGYGSTNWNKKKGTYGGDGWDMGADGYWELHDYGTDSDGKNKPDFDDQVIEVELIPDAAI